MKHESVNKMQVNNKEIWITLGLAVIGFAAAWGSLNTKVSEHDDQLKQLSPLPVQVAQIGERVYSIDQRTSEIQSDLRALRLEAHQTAGLQRQGQQQPQSIRPAYRPETSTEGQIEAAVLTPAGTRP